MIKFTKYRTIYFLISGLLIIASLLSLFIYGLKPGIDFTGGSILEIQYENERPASANILSQLEEFDLGTINIQETGDQAFILRMKEITESTHQNILAKLRGAEKIETDAGLVLETSKIRVTEVRFESIGPVIGNELKQKTNIVVIVALLAMIIYIAIAFRKIQRPLRSWQYGIVSVIALFHDLIIPLGIFVYLGKYYGVEISIPIVTALLAVLGYSINNTVVVFDRIRENLLTKNDNFEDTVNISLTQTLSRQINTSLTTLLVSLAIFFLGGATLKYFALTLIIGILAGTYSSIFLAGPILVAWYKLKNRNSA